MRRRHMLAILLAGLAWTMPGAVSAQETAGHLVLTSLQATYSIASALAQGTRIRVVNVPPQGAVMESQAYALSRADAALFRQADAVVGISKLWRDDPLFPVARSHNLRIVNIDAAFPWTTSEVGVAVIRKPDSDVPWAGPKAGAETSLSRYIWLSPTNAACMAELVAGDLARLSPADAKTIGTNLAAFTTSMRQLKAEYGSRFATLADPRVLSLADEFVYLFSDLGVFVDGWFVRQDVNWKAEDHAALTAYLKDHGIGVVVHKWEPDAKIGAAITAAGAKLVVLDTGDPGAASRNGPLPANGYQALMRNNMEALLAALGAG